MTAPFDHSNVSIANSQKLGRPVSNKETVGMSWEKPSKNTRRQHRQKSMEFRKNFKQRWSAFINAEFDGPAETALEFGCDYGTAEGWHDGMNGPSGPFVGLAFARWPEKAFNYLRD